MVFDDKSHSNATLPEEPPRHAIIGLNSLGNACETQIPSSSGIKGKRKGESWDGEQKQASDVLLPSSIQAPSSPGVRLLQSRCPFDVAPHITHMRGP